MKRIIPTILTVLIVTASGIGITSGPASAAPKCSARVTSSFSAPGYTGRLYGNGYIDCGSGPSRPISATLFIVRHNWDGSTTVIDSRPLKANGTGLAISESALCRPLRGTATITYSIAIMGKGTDGKSVGTSGAKRSLNYSCAS